MDEPVRLLPPGLHAIFNGKFFIQYDPSECDSKLLRKNLMSFSDKRLDGVRALKSVVEHTADHVMLSPRHVLNRYFSIRAIEQLESARENNEFERLFDASEPSSELPVPGAFTTREAVQEEIDSLRERYNFSLPVRAHFVEKMSDYPRADGLDAATAFHGLRFLPRPYLIEIVLSNEFLTYPSKYRKFLLLHEFAHCVQMLDAWPDYDDSGDHHDESYTRACAKMGIEPIDSHYYPSGSYRVVCLKCGDIRYIKEGETMRNRGMDMEEFTKVFKCGFCMGSIRSERIDAPVIIMGDEVYEVVSPDGDSCELIGTFRQM